MKRARCLCALVLLAVAAGMACRPDPVPLALAFPNAQTSGTIVLAIGEGPARFFAGSIAAGTLALPVDLDPSARVSIRALLFAETLDDLQLDAGELAPAPAGTRYPLRLPETGAPYTLAIDGGVAGTWTPQQMPDRELSALTYAGKSGACARGKRTDRVRDDGTGTCIALDAPCAPMHRDDALGNCSPDDRCATGFHDGGKGVCRPEGVCDPDFHDGGDGKCVARSACSEGRKLVAGACPLVDECGPGMHDGGAGCVDISTCSPGFQLDGFGTCWRWRVVGRLNVPRAWARAVRLADGGVLVVAGRGDPVSRCDTTTTDFLSSTERFDPETESFRLWSNLGDVRGEKPIVATVAGKILAASGRTGTVVTDAELLDTSRAGPPMRIEPGLHHSRFGAASVVLEGGRVLIAGGGENYQSPALFAESEIFDYRAQAFVPGPSLQRARRFVGSARLPDGRILFAGGASTVGADRASYRVFSDVDVYDPARNDFAPAAPLAHARADAEIVTLPDGRVMAIGGESDNGGVLDTAEIFDPDEGLWIATPPMSTPRFNHTATVLADGRVLVAGGWIPLSDSGDHRDSAELYDPASDRWVSLAPMPPSHFAGGLAFSGRAVHVAMRLDDRRVLIAGGCSGQGPVEYAVIYETARSALSR